MSPAHRRFLLLALVLAAPAVGWGQTTPATAVVRYTLSVADREHHLLRVKLDPVPASDLKVQLPVWNALYQVRDFAQYVLWLDAADAEGRPIAIRKLDKTTWSVPNAATVQYVIAAELPGPYGAQLDLEHGFFNFALLLMYPIGQRSLPIRVTLQDVPTNWRVATPLPPDGSADSFRAQNYDHLVDSPLEMGEFREASFQEGGATFRIVVHADPADYDFAALVVLVHKIVTAAVGWMNDRPFDQYIFFYHFPRAPAGGGMEHAYSTAIDANAAQIKQGLNSIAGVTAHEFFHLWNVKRIRPQSLEPVDYTQENYTRALWFSEGVTSTVAEYVLLRAGLRSEKQFLQVLAGEIKALENRPAARVQSAEESSLDTWFDKYPFYGQPERSISYYNKGEVLGFLLDLELREATAGVKSLRELFQWMNLRYARQGKFFPDTAGVQEAAQAISGRDFGPFFRAYVSGLEPLPYERDFATVGLKLEHRKIMVPDAGFRLAPVREQRRVVLSVDAGSAAERAGLRPGDIIREVDERPVVGAVEPEIEKMKPGDLLRLRVSGQRGQRDLRFKLAGREQDAFALVDVPMITPAQRARRAAWLRQEPEPPAPR